MIRLFSMRFTHELHYFNQDVVPIENQASTHPHMSVHEVQSDEPNYEVEFSQTSTLSYMERILLNKHRYTIIENDVWITASVLV